MLSMKVAQRTGVMPFTTSVLPGCGKREKGRNPRVAARFGSYLEPLVVQQDVVTGPARETFALQLREHPNLQTLGLCGLWSQRAACSPSHVCAATALVELPPVF